MMRIYLVAHFCGDFSKKDNNRFNYLASLLAAAGNDVHFFTTDYSHLRKERRVTESLDLPYMVHFVHEHSYQRNISIQRILSHREFGRNLKKALASIKRPDVVYLAAPSIDAAFVTAKYCVDNMIPYIVDIQDLWPEAFQLVLKYMDFLFTGMRKKIDFVYQNASKVIAVSQTYVDRANCVRENSDNSQCIFLGTDLEVFDTYPVLPVEKMENEVWVVYIGTLGASYNLNIVIDAVSKLYDYGVRNFSLQIFGDGPKMEEFMVSAKDLPVRFWGRQPYPELIGYVKNGDIAVNPIAKGAAQSIINKHADYAAAGLPVVNTQECKEYRDLLERYECGINCGVESVEEVAEALKELIENPEKRKQMGANSRRMAEERFDRRNTYQQIVRAVEELTR